DADADRPEAVTADEVFLHGPDGHQDLIVGVIEAGPALRLEQSDDPEADPADRDVRTDGVRAEAQVVGGGLAKDCQAEVEIDGGVAETRALPDAVRTDAGIGARRA